MIRVKQGTGKKLRAKKTIIFEDVIRVTRNKKTLSKLRPHRVIVPNRHFFRLAK